MSTANLHALPRRRESRFGDRVVWSLGERAPSVFAGFAQAAQVHATRTALVFEGRRWTYSELDREVGRLASGLRSMGLQPGERVALWVRNRPEFVMLFYAVQALSGVLVPMDVRLQGAEAGFAIADAGAVLLIHDTGLAERLAAVRAAAPNCRCVALPEIPGERLFGEQADCGSAPVLATDPESAAMILYTSGSTGKPKGAVLAHVNVAHAALLQSVNLGLGRDDVTQMALPLAHVSGVICGLVAPLWSGGCLALLPQFKARDFLQAAQDTGMTYTLMVPAMFNLCLRVADFEQFDLSRWRVGHFGGAPMPEATIDELARKLPHLILVNGYGATETCSPAIMSPVGERPLPNASVGKALACVEVITVDPETGCETPPGEPGEIWIRSPGVIPRYWNNPEASAQALVGGYWRSGDLGVIEADGSVYVRDRIKDMINRGGHKIYSAEVEAVLYQFSGVVEAAIVARPDPVLGERAHAFVCVREGVTEDQLAQFCAERLGDYKVPESWTLGSEPLPRNSSGKLAKKDLRALLALQAAHTFAVSGKST